MTEPTVIVVNNGEEVSRELGKLIEAEAISVLKSPDSVLVIGLSGGSLPNFFASAAKDLQLDWGRVKFIFCDERMVPENDPESTFGVYKEKLIGKISGIEESNFVRVDTGLEVDKAAEKYAQDIGDLNKGSPIPKFDILLLGMGPDGHTCSLFPGHPLLEEKTLLVAPISDSPKPPPQRVTLTYPVLNNSAVCIFVSTGEGKKEILEKIIKLKEDYPAGRVKPVDGKLFWILDSPAAQNL